MIQSINQKKIYLIYFRMVGSSRLKTKFCQIQVKSIKTTTNFEEVDQTRSLKTNWAQIISTRLISFQDALFVCF